jgi:hypothetical protein
VIWGLLIWVVVPDQEEIMGARDAVNQAVAPQVAVVLEEYRVFLVAERGLAAESVRCYCSHARVFLAQLPDPVEAGLAGLSAGRVTAYAVGYCQGRNTWSAKAMVTALRSLLRYLHVSGRSRFGPGIGRRGARLWSLSVADRGGCTPVMSRGDNRLQSGGLR